MPLTFAPDKLLGVGSKHLRARTGLRYANIPPGVPNGPFEWVGRDAEDCGAVRRLGPGDSVLQPREIVDLAGERAHRSRVSREIDRERHPDRQSRIRLLKEIPPFPF